MGTKWKEPVAFVAQKKLYVANGSIIVILFIGVMITAGVNNQPPQFLRIRNVINQL